MTRHIRGLGAAGAESVPAGAGALRSGDGPGSRRLVTTQAECRARGHLPFRIDGASRWTDPRALRLPEGPHGPAMVHDPTGFPWTDDAWRGVPLPGSVIYELHVGTFTERGDSTVRSERLGPPRRPRRRPGRAVLPLASFPGHHKLGVRRRRAVRGQESYGGPDAMMRFVDACHRRGLGVCLDVVYNHAGWGSGCGSSGRTSPRRAPRGGRRSTWTVRTATR
jgi:1,4-alpha-glucan branching enzyme